jgi:Beta-propeller repeat
VLYSTYLEGTTYDEGFGIAVDSTGAAYVTGWTSSSDFPLASPFDNTVSSQDVFVTKLSPSGNSLVYSTFLGGGGNDKGFAIAVDGTGAAYVTGDTLSTNFPAVSAFQALGGGDWDAFVTKLTPAGGLAYSTYLGGLDLDEATGIAVDGNGAAYVTGYTLSTNFPTQGPCQATNHGYYDAFVTKLAPAGNALVYSTYLGGTDEDQASGIAVDGTGAAYVTGLTFSSNFPTASAFDSVYKSGDAFVTKLTPAGNTLAYSTYLGGALEDAGYAIAVDAAGSAYVTGRTESADFPTGLLPIPP